MRNDLSVIFVVAGLGLVLTMIRGIADFFHVGEDVAAEILFRGLLALPLLVIGGGFVLWKAEKKWSGILLLIPLVLSGCVQVLFPVIEFWARHDRFGFLRNEPSWWGQPWAETAYAVGILVLLYGGYGIWKWRRNQ